MEVKHGLLLKEKAYIRAFENVEQRIISGTKRKEVTGEWIKLHNEEL
jgi:hypothetical protein